MSHVRLLLRFVVREFAAALVLADLNFTMVFEDAVSGDPTHMLLKMDAADLILAELTAGVAVAVKAMSGTLRGSTARNASPKRR